MYPIMFQKRGDIFLLAVFLGYLALVLTAPVKTPRVYSRDLETELRTTLFTNYSSEQRPSELVIVYVSLTLITINDMNIKDQTLSISGYFKLAWSDDRLAWNSLTDYANIRFMFSSQQFLWRPALVVDNSVKNLDVISKVDVPMRILSNGMVVWSPADIYQVSCESDTTYYPMDTQSCVISLSSWSYTSNEVVLILDRNDGVNMDYYTENGEWEMISAYADKTDGGSKSRGDTSFSTAKFYINLRRRPMFHILNTLFPVALMAVLSAMVFKLSVDSGEKIGFSLTVLLAYAVYLTLISESIPSTSITLCYLSIYLSLILALGTLSVLCTILVVSVYNHPDQEEEIPGWLRSFTVCLMRITCWNGCCKSLCCKKKKQVEPFPNKFITVRPGRNIGEKAAIDDIEIVSVTSPPEEEVHINWQVVSRVLDHFFFWLFMTLILASSIFFFLIMAVEYVNISREET